jgi:putative transposase
LVRRDVIVTDLLRSYGATMKVIGNVDKQEVGRWLNNRAENSHPLPGSGLFANQEKGPFRRQERAMQRFRSMRTLQKFVSVHASVHNYVIDS